MEDFNYKEKVKGWLGRIFSMQTLGLLVAIASLLVGAHQLWLAKTGAPVVEWEGKPILENAYLRTYLYTPEDPTMNIGPLLPKIENPGRHSVKDLSVKYVIDNRRMNVIYNSYYKLQFVAEGADLRNSENILPAFEKMNSPIDFIELHKILGECFISCRLTYNGIEKPLEYQHHLYVRKMGKHQFVRKAIEDFLSHREYPEDCALYLYVDYDFKKVDIDRLLSGQDSKYLIDSLETELTPMILSEGPNPPQLGVLLN